MKSKISKEGLFDENRKKAIPKIPRRVGVITSPTGAAVRDIINVTGRRFPYAEIVIYPSLVQGPDAALSLCNGVQYFNEKNNVDTIIIGRGGGSLEDLWAFNDEMLARTISASDIPIISAVGHETDFTICDFVSDMRAPTPSAAAELAVANVEDIKRNLDKYENRLAISLNKKLELMKLRYEKVMNLRVFKEPLLRIHDEYVRLDNMIKLIYDKAIEKHKESNFIFLNLVSKLDSLSPLKTLTRGYSIVQKDNKIIKSKSDLNDGDNIKITLVDGDITAVIKE